MRGYSYEVDGVRHVTSSQLHEDGLWQGEKVCGSAGGELQMWKKYGQEAPEYDLKCRKEGLKCCG